MSPLELRHRRAAAGQFVSGVGTDVARGGIAIETSGLAIAVVGSRIGNVPMAAFGAGDIVKGVEIAAVRGFIAMGGAFLKQQEVGQTRQ